MKDISISYAIMCCNEYEESLRLIDILLENKRDQDEIIVLFDDKGDKRIWEFLIDENSKINLIHRSVFNNNFAEWRNKIKKLCSKDYIFYIDADEYPNVNLLNKLPSILSDNPEVEMFYVPRINTVSSIGKTDVQKWGWNVSKIDSMIEEKEFDLSNPQDLDEYNLLKKYNLIIEES